MDANESFVVAWQQSGSVREVAEKLRIDTHAINCRATQLRRHGLPLKPMPCGAYRPAAIKISRIDATALAELCRKYGPDFKCAQCSKRCAGVNQDSYDPEICFRCAELNDREMVAEAEREGYCEEAA